MEEDEDPSLFEAELALMEEIEGEGRAQDDDIQETLGID